MPSEYPPKRSPEWRAQKEAEWAKVDEDWNAFPNLPGTHLLWHKASHKKWELKSKNGSPWAVLTPPVDAPGCRVAVGTTEYVVDGGKVRRSSKEYLSRHLQVLDASGASVMSWTGGHYDYKARTRFTVADGQQFTFPIRQHGKSMLMAAVVEGSDASLISYRIKRGFTTWLGPSHSHGLIFSVEIVVSPDGLAIPDVGLLVALTSHLPWFYPLKAQTVRY